MSITVEPPSVEGPDAGVIEEARARQRRHRGIAGAALVAAAIAALVATSLGGGGGSSYPVTGSVRPARPPSTATSTVLAACSRHGSPFITGTPSRSLLAILGVLRRPATPMDALPTSLRHSISTVGNFSGIEVFANYVRRARVVAGVSYYVWPVAHRPCGPLRALSEQETMDIAYTHGWGGAGDAATIENATSLGGGTSTFGKSTIVGLVPDGVAMVTLHYPAGKIGGFDRNHAPAFTLTTNVVGNVLVATIPRGGNRLMAPMTMLWRAANGAVIKTFNKL
jgi:hypothetical protein